MKNARPMLGLWFGTVAAALPFAMMLQVLIADHLGASLTAQAVADGVNYDWWNEFLAQTSGLGATFVPAILGFAAVMKNVSTFADVTAMRIQGLHPCTESARSLGTQRLLQLPLKVWRNGHGRIR